MKLFCLEVLGYKMAVLQCIATKENGGRKDMGSPKKDFEGNNPSSELWEKKEKQEVVRRNRLESQGKMRLGK